MFKMLNFPIDKYIIPFIFSGALLGSLVGLKIFSIKARVFLVVKFYTT